MIEDNWFCRVGVWRITKIKWPMLHIHLVKEKHGVFSAIFDYARPTGHSPNHHWPCFLVKSLCLLVKSLCLLGKSHETLNIPSQDPFVCWWNILFCWLNPFFLLVRLNPYFRWFEPLLLMVPKCPTSPHPQATVIIMAAENSRSKDTAART
jgi:hypothetical protein